MDVSSRPLEIVLGAHNFAWPGGSETYVLTVAEQLQRLGHGVTIFAHELRTMADEARDRGLRVGSQRELPSSCDVVLVQDGVCSYELAVEDDVFIGPNVITTDDDTIGRRPPGVERRPCILRRGCRIGAATIPLPGVEVGEEALVGAGSLVRVSVPARTLVVGVPARHVRDLVAP